MVRVPTQHRYEREDDEPNNEYHFARREVELSLAVDLVRWSTLIEREKLVWKSRQTFTANAFKQKKMTRQKDTQMAGLVSGNLKDSLMSKRSQR